MELGAEKKVNAWGRKCTVLIFSYRLESDLDFLD